MLLLTHPRTIAGFALGTFSLVAAHSLLDEYKQNNMRLQEIRVLDNNHAHEKAGWDHDKAKWDHEKAQWEHEKFIIQHSRWWKRFV